MSENYKCKVYIGGLAKPVTEEDLENAFKSYGPLRNVWVARNPPGFAFLEFEDHRDAEDAIETGEGTNVCGNRVRVEKCQEKRRSRREGFISRNDGYRDRRDYDRNDSYRRNDSHGGERSERTKKAFSSSDRCFNCDKQGHYAYDCDMKRGYVQRGRDRDEHRQRSRSRSRDNRRRSSPNNRR